MTDPTSDVGWAIVELIDHQRRAGRVTVVVAGVKLLRLDIPGDGELPPATQLYGIHAIYCITPVDEDTARRVAARYRPKSGWHLSQRTTNDEGF